MDRPSSQWAWNAVISPDKSEAERGSTGTEWRPCDHGARDWVMQPQAKEWRQSPGAGQEMDFPLQPTGGVSCSTLSLDFWPLELWKNKFLCFQPLICDNFNSSPRKQVQWAHWSWAYFLKGSLSKLPNQSEKEKTLLCLEGFWTSSWFQTAIMVTGALKSNGLLIQTVVF